MTSQENSEDKTSLLISAKKYSTIAEFQEDIDNIRCPPPKNLEKSDEEIKQEEEEAKKKEEEESIKEKLLTHWSKLLLKEPPKRRSNHTSFIHGDYFYVVGGIDITEHKQDDIYKVNLKEPNASWTKVDIMGENLEKISYHAGAEIDGFYYIVGGQNETLQTLNTIQVFDIAQETLSEKIELDPEKFPPLESHTVNPNLETKTLIIYGGISGKKLNRDIYCYDTQNKEMKNLTSELPDEEVPPPRQDHAAVLYNNALYIYGGLGLDNKIYDDMWKYDFSSNTWTELRTEAQQKKIDKKKQKEMEREANKENNENKETIDEDEELDLDDDEEIKDIRPKGRSGHSMVNIGDEFFIFGGKTGLIKESNEIWKFIPERTEYECVHETLLEQFTKEELSKISAENKKDEKKFRWLTRSDVEKRTNPSFNSYKSEAEIEKEKERKKKKEKMKNNQQGTTNVKNVKIDKNKKTTKKQEKKQDKNSNKDAEGKYAEQVLCRPNVVKMRKTLIFTSNPDKIKEGLNILSKDEKEKINEQIVRIKGEIPEPRDGQTACVEGSNIYIFGGDRFKFPFNDLFVLDTISLPLLPMKENKRLKREKEKAKEEREEREKMRQIQEELKQEMKQEEIIEDNEEDKEEKDEKKSKKDENKEEPKDDNEKIGEKDDREGHKEEKDEKKSKKDENKEEPKDDNEKIGEKDDREGQRDNKVEQKDDKGEIKEEKKEDTQKEDTKKEEEKKEVDKGKNEEEELLTLEEKIVYREGEA